MEKKARNSTFRKRHRDAKGHPGDLKGRPAQATEDRRIRPPDPPGCSGPHREHSRDGAFLLALLCIKDAMGRSRAFFGIEFGAGSSSRGSAGICSGSVLGILVRWVVSGSGSRGYEKQNRER